jgi:hypothetical protein
MASALPPRFRAGAASLHFEGNALRHGMPCIILGSIRTVFAPVTP